MKTRSRASALAADAQQTADAVQSQRNRVAGRRSFVKGVGLLGAAMLPGGALIASRALARTASPSSSSAEGQAHEPELSQDAKASADYAAPRA
jgi:hypothetical protein